VTGLYHSEREVAMAKFQNRTKRDCRLWSMSLLVKNGFNLWPPYVATPNCLQKRIRIKSELSGELCSFVLMLEEHGCCLCCE
jgi:hypothetical protein